MCEEHKLKSRQIEESHLNLDLIIDGLRSYLQILNIDTDMITDNHVRSVHENICIRSLRASICCS